LESLKNGLYRRRLAGQNRDSSSSSASGTLALQTANMPSPFASNKFDVHPWVILFILLVALPAHALRPDVGVSQYPVDQWLTAHGLLADSIRSIVQTRDGYLWLATSAGLNRFDGDRFESFYKKNVPEMDVDRVTSLLEDRDGSLWIGTEGGGLLNYRNERFTVFTTSDGISDDYISALAQDGEGNLWIATRDEITILKKGEFLPISISQVHALYADLTAVWIGTENGLDIAEGSKITHHPANAVTALHKTRNGEIWLAVRDRGLCKMLNGQIVTVLDTKEAITAIAADRDQNLWVGTAHGLRRFQESTLVPHREIDTPVASILEDQEGSLWVATAHDGLYRLRPSPFVSITRDDGLADDRVWCVLQDRAGNVWIGTNSGVSRWKGNAFANYATPAPVKALGIDAEGTVWIATPAGLMRWEGKSFSMTIPGVYANSIQADHHGTLWIGAKDGLYSYEQGRLRKEGVEETTTLYLDSKSVLWIGTNSGLRRWKSGDAGPPLIEDPVSCIQEDRNGNLWVGTSRGMNSILNEKVKSYTAQNRLPDEQVSSILEDRAGNLWMSSRRGVFRLEQKPDGIRSVAYGSVQGLASGECADGEPAGWKTADGKFLFATVRGVAIIDPNHYFVNSVPPPVVIESIVVDRMPIRDITAADLQFPARSSRVEIFYSGISYLPSLKFRYLLQGFDKSWTNAGSRRSATYTNLLPGKYRFKVLACNSDGVWNIEGKSVAFEILRAGLPFRWSTIFGLAVAALSGFAAGWFARRRRVNGQPR